MKAYPCFNHEPGRNVRPGFLLMEHGSKNMKGRYAMKFLLIVLMVHFAAEVLIKTQKKVQVQDNEVNGNVRHPAENLLR